MELKYYLRGLGLGIAVTAVIMGIALPNNRVMTNDEIIARAKELGLVENTVLANTGDADASQENEDDDGSDMRYMADQTQDDLTEAGSVMDTAPNIGDAGEKENGDSATGAEGENDPETDNAGQGNTNPENAADEGSPGSEGVSGEEKQGNTAIRDGKTDNSNGTVTSTAVKVITINSGDSSYTVAKKLADAGVVTSAQDFDTFLCQNGYDKRLRTGNYSIPSNASDEQIARIVTGAE